MPTSLAKQAESSKATVLRDCPACGCPDAQDWVAAPDRFHGRLDLYKLVRCKKCSLVWLLNAPPTEEIGQHYGPQYDKSVATAGEDPNRWSGRREVIERQMPLGGSILDLGCSSGGFLTSLKGSWCRYGIEMSERAATMARRQCGADVFVGDILDAPFAPATFDVVTCFHVFEHLYHPREVLSRVSTWLKPDGVFYIMVPNIDSAGAKIFGSYWYALELPRHLCHFSPASLTRLALSVGLEPVSLATHREVFVESSVRYLVDETLMRVGFRRASLAEARTPRLPWRVVRKGLRLTVLPVLNGLASFAGDGESIHAIFRKKAVDTL